MEHHPAETAMARPRPGRQRSPDSHSAILTAAWELTVELGYPGLTVEGIATRAGTGKQTVYRWWPSKADVLLDALALKADLHIGLDDLGSYAADLRRFLERSFELACTPEVATVMRTLMAQAQIDPDFGHRFEDQFLVRRRAALSVLTDRAQQRGDLTGGPADIHAQVVFGTIWYSVLTRSVPPDEREADVLVAGLVGLLAPDHSPS